MSNFKSAKIERWIVMHGEVCSFRVRSSPDFCYLDRDGDAGVVMEICEDGDRWVHVGYVGPEFFEGMIEAFAYFLDR